MSKKAAQEWELVNPEGVEKIAPMSVNWRWENDLISVRTAPCFDPRLSRTPVGHLFR